MAFCVATEAYFCSTFWVALLLSLQPLVFHHAVERDEWKQDGGVVYVGLVFGVVTVDFVLAQLQATGTAEHNVDDADVAYGGDDPLPHGEVCADAAEQHACPDDHLAKVVGAAHDAVETCVDESFGIALLGSGLLRVGSGFEQDATEHQGGANPRPQFADLAAGPCVHQAESHRADLQHVQYGAEEPDSNDDTDGFLLLQRWVVEDFTVGCSLALADKQVGAQTETEDDEQRTQRHGGCRELAAEHHQQGSRERDNAVAVAQTEEIDEILPAHGRHREGYCEKDKEWCHNALCVTFV